MLTRWMFEGGFWLSSNRCLAVNDTVTPDRPGEALPSGSAVSEIVSGCASDTGRARNRSPYREGARTGGETMPRRRAPASATRFFVKCFLVVLSLRGSIPGAPPTPVATTAEHWLTGPASPANDDWTRGGPTAGDYPWLDPLVD